MLKKVLATLAVALTLLAVTAIAKPKQLFIIQVLTSHTDGPSVYEKVLIQNGTVADAIASGLRINVDAANDSQKYTLRCVSGGGGLGADLSHCPALNKGMYQGWSYDYPLRIGKSYVEVDGADPVDPTKRKKAVFQVFAQSWPLDWE